MRQLFLFCFVLFNSFNLFSQQYVESKIRTYTPDKKLNLRMGIGAQYQGSIMEKLQDFNRNNVRLFAEGFGGIKLDAGESGSSFLGIFGRYSSIGSKTIDFLKADNAIVYTEPAKYALQYEIEAGVILHDWFRLSAGKGRWQVKNSNNTKGSAINYVIVTSGINLKFESFNMFANGSVLFQNDLKKYIYRGSVGFMVDFRFLSMGVK